MTTARDIIKSALRKIHVLGKGQSLDADEANDAFLALNSMMSSWSAEGQLVFAETRETFPLTSAGIYTIGSGADFDTARPLKFLNVFVTVGDIDYPLIEIDSTEYNSIAYKDITTGYPDCFYYDANYPTAKIYLYTKPSGGTITFTSVKPLTQFVSLDSDLSMPLEYVDALTYNLAVRLAPEYEREAAPTVKQIANQTKTTVMVQNKQNQFYRSVVDVPSRGNLNRYNIYEGNYT
jgi:hypothetical protein